MGAEERATLVSTPEAMARAVGVQPLYVVETAEGLSAAKWRFQAFRALREEYPQSCLACRTAGSACVTKTYGGKAVRKRPKIGAVTFSSGDGRAVCSLDGPAEAVHIYLRRDHI